MCIAIAIGVFVEAKRKTFNIDTFTSLVICQVSNFNDRKVGSGRASGGITIIISVYRTHLQAKFDSTSNFGRARLNIMDHINRIRTLECTLQYSHQQRIIRPITLVLYYHSC